MIYNRALKNILKKYIKEEAKLIKCYNEIIKWVEIIIRIAFGPEKKDREKDENIQQSK